MRATRRYVIATLVAVVCSLSGWAQLVVFPYPHIPATLSTPDERLSYTLEHFWSNYDFKNPSQANQQAGEQGFVDFINLMSHADSTLCAKAAHVVAQQLGSGGEMLFWFEGLMDHYLGNAESPLKDDAIYVHLLRALPSSPQRTFLIKQLTQNLPGTIAADITFINEQGETQQLSSICHSLTILVFFDPQCDHCQEMMPHIHEAFRDKKVVYINVDKNPNIQRYFYLPTLPSLYLLDEHRRVVVKDGTIKEICER